jgi:uracil-DNA glycosylase family 4
MEVQAEHLLAVGGTVGVANAYVSRLLFDGVVGDVLSLQRPQRRRGKVSCVYGASPCIVEAAGGGGVDKPDRCRECSWYGDGRGFVPDDTAAGNATVLDGPIQVLFICQNPGDVEETQARPLVGVTGQMFRGRFVGKWLPGVRVAYANVIKCRGMNKAGVKTNSMPQLHSEEWRVIRDHCRPYLEETLARCPDAVVVPMGEYAAEAVTGLKAKVMLHLRGTVVER